MARRDVFVKAALVLAIIWGCVWGVRAFAGSRKITVGCVNREAARSRLADLELDYGVEKSKLVRMFHPDLHGGAHAPSRVVFSALAEIMRRIKRTA